MRQAFSLFAVVILCACAGTKKYEGFDKEGFSFSEYARDANNCLDNASSLEVSEDYTSNDLVKAVYGKSPYIEKREKEKHLMNCMVSKGYRYRELTKEEYDMRGGPPGFHYSYKSTP